MGQIADLLRAALARGDAARYVLRGTDDDAAWTWQGECCRLLGEAIPQVEALETAPPPPDPVPTPAPQFVAPIANGATYGQTKWYRGPDSPYGCDLFCARHTVVVAPADCIVEEVIPGQGISGGAELILATADKSWAWRYRHVQGSVRVGQGVKQGQAVATVQDTSLDILCAPPVMGYPAGWQHLDLSVNQGTDRFTPTGGAGGNVSAYAWLESLGYQGTVVSRTPGPPSCGVGQADAVLMMTPEGRR